MDNIRILLSLGYEVDVATNFDNPGTISLADSKKLIEELREMSVGCFQIDFSRNVTDFKMIIKSFKQLRQLSLKDYDIMHCHSPIGGALARMAFKNKKTSIMYTAHGFHFFRGGPIKDWILYYPVERYLSRYTDYLLIINDGDASVAKKFKATQVIQLPGVGIDWEKYNIVISENEKKELKRKFKIDKSTKVMISVGELNNNKNHILGIKAVKELSKYDLEYIICGIGQERESLIEKSKELGVIDKVHLLGFRNDIEKIYKICDICLFPSKREGLGLAGLEAMASGLPLVTSSVGGIKDYMTNGRTGYMFSDLVNPKELVAAVEKILEMDSLKLNEISNYNKAVSKKYDKENVSGLMRKIYKEIH